MHYRVGDHEDLGEIVSVCPGADAIAHLSAIPSPGALFGYVDARDLAVAFRLILEAPAAHIQDEVFNIVADDALATEPLADLLPRMEPALAELAAGLTGNQSMLSAERIKQKLGWQPAHSWRDVITDL